MKKNKILLGISGSFCNHETILKEIRKLVIDYDIQIIVSDNVYTLDTRFHDALPFIKELETCTNHEVWHTLVEAEKVGPMYGFDLMVIAPMTGTVLSKLKNGIYDNPVTLAAKAHLRNGKNVVIAVSSNDLLSISGVNLFTVLNYKNIYCVPFYQDNPYVKPNSLTSEWSLLESTIEAALINKQIQPILLERKVV